jgi:hypothetical protein
MPQEFVVLRCFKCLTFQVHQAKKSPKWNCKICNEKQTVKRMFGRGSGKECRIIVMEMNGLRQQVEDNQEEIVQDVVYGDAHNDDSRSHDDDSHDHVLYNDGHVISCDGHCDEEDLNTKTRTSHVSKKIRLV